MGNRYNRALQALAGGATALLLALPAYADTWTNYGGNWSHSGSTHTVDAGLGNKAIQAGTSYQSSTMEADIALGANGDAGFIFMPAIWYRYRCVFRLLRGPEYAKEHRGIRPRQQ